ncbi:site-specific DNA-methyltransferase [Neisseria sp. CCUG17229]|uniref:site-specific DNA-methyltransferase n=1 Tax=Neisseria sp. CCUG17229 TaxID=3392036 RepID=UPI003A102D93
MLNHDSDSFLSDRLQQFKTLFPEAFCENQIDWEKLKLILGEDNLCAESERYQLNWAGKTAAYRALQSPTFNTLIPCQSESVDFDNTQNVFIEAENMEALKILQKAYAGSVKMIYIDPPYNTGSDSFIYPDKFSETREEYAKRVGDKDEAGYLKRDGVFQGAFRKNAKDNGHYHSNWLNMMLPRLHLAKTLLREDGVIFISIDDNEQAQLKLLCDEVFGAENFVAEIAWRRTDNQPNIGNLAKVKEYLICYAKNVYELELGKLSLTDKALKEYRYSDENGLFRRKILLDKTRGRHFYDVKTKSGNILTGPWMIKKEDFERLDAENGIYWTSGGDEQPYGKLYLDGSKGQIPNDFWGIEFGTNQRGSLEVEELLENRYFDFPKPILLINNLLKLGSNSNALILDFFSGSGTTAHAVMQLNAEDNGNRRYICVQLPEETDEKSEARKAGFSNIAEIAKERIRRAGAQIRRVHLDAPINAAAATNGATSRTLPDTGFKVFKLSASHFKQWRNPAKLDEAGLTAQLEMFQNVVAEEASAEHMAYELALRLGFQLTDPMIFSDGIVWLNNIAGTRKTALFLETFSDDLLLQCLAQSPQKIFVLDRVFNGDDALKTNAALQCEDAGVAFETL